MYMTFKNTSKRTKRMEFFFLEVAIHKKAFHCVNLTIKLPLKELNNMINVMILDKFSSNSKQT